ncbi:peptide ABC transporter permease [Deltaproteobacteria bacterium]|nr:peptide ABC transporter permease [Deltaproteobacteria bacterium]
MTLRPGLILAFIVLAFLPYDPLADVGAMAADLGAGPGHWLGTDHLGRDILARTRVGGRIVVLSGGLAMLVAGGLGVGLGALAGWFGGLPAAALRALGGGLSAIPSLVLVVLACLAFGGGPLTLAIGCGFASVPAVAEAVAGRLDALRREEFVVAARGHGIGNARIFLWHLLWVNTRRLVARELGVTLTLLVVTEVTVAYLGAFGVPEPTVSWGNMLDHALRSGCANPWSWGAPALATAATVWATAPAEEPT